MTSFLVVLTRRRGGAQSRDLASQAPSLTWCAAMPPDKCVNLFAFVRGCKFRDVAKLDYSGIWLAPRKSFHPATPVAWSVRPTPTQLLQHDSTENIPACVVSNDLSCDVWSQASHRPTLRSSLQARRQCSFLMQLKKPPFALERRVLDLLALQADVVSKTFSDCARPAFEFRALPFEAMVAMQKFSGR